MCEQCVYDAECERDAARADLARVTAERDELRAELDARRKIDHVLLTHTPVTVLQRVNGGDYLLVDLECGEMLAGGSDVHWLAKAIPAECLP